MADITTAATAADSASNLRGCFTPACCTIEARVFEVRWVSLGSECWL